MPLLRENGEAAWPKRTLHAEAWATLAIGPGYELLEFPAPSYLARSGSRKLLRLNRTGGARYQAYDLEKDPYEKAGLLPGAETYADLVTAVDTYEAACRLAIEEGRARSAEIERPPVESEPPTLDANTREKLRALGYLREQ
jgi:hypothetical protein